jgi:hypothetical protein
LRFRFQVNTERARVARDFAGRSFGNFLTVMQHDDSLTIGTCLLGGRLFLIALIRAHFLNWEILIPILPVGIFLPAASVRAMRRYAASIGFALYLTSRIEIAKRLCFETEQS